MSPRKQDLIWEALAAAKVAPVRAVLLMASHGIIVSVVGAAQHLADASRRNALRLVHFSSQENFSSQEK